MILSRVSFRSIRACLSLWGDDADFGADVVSGSDPACPLHGARGSCFDFLLHLLGRDHVDRRPLHDLLASINEKVGEFGFRDGNRHPWNPNNEVSHELWLSGRFAARLRRSVPATGKPVPRAPPQPGLERTWRPPARQVQP